jgi:hypothetical protein
LGVSSTKYGNLKIQRLDNWLCSRRPLVVHGEKTARCGVESGENNGEPIGLKGTAAPLRRKMRGAGLPLKLSCSESHNGEETEGRESAIRPALPPWRPANGGRSGGMATTA